MMTEQNEQTGQTEALWNLRAVLPDEYRKVVKVYAAEHGLSVPDVVALAIRTLAAQDGRPMTYIPASYARAS